MVLHWTDNLSVYCASCLAGEVPLVSEAQFLISKLGLVPYLRGLRVCNKIIYVKQLDGVSSEVGAQ